MDEKRATIVKIIETCSACPSQWDMWDAKGNYYYVRYRWGWLQVDQGEVGNAIYGDQLGDNLDGTMSMDVMIEKLQNTKLLDFSESVICEFPYEKGLG